MARESISRITASSCLLASRGRERAEQDAALFAFTFTSWKSFNHRKYIHQRSRPHCMYMMDAWVTAVVTVPSVRPTSGGQPQRRHPAIRMGRHWICVRRVPVTAKCDGLRGASRGLHFDQTQQGRERQGPLHTIFMRHYRHHIFLTTSAAATLFSAQTLSTLRSRPWCCCLGMV